MADHATHGRQTVLSEGGAGAAEADEAAARLEAGRLLFAQACTFERGVADLHQLPESDLPEVAFAGRSNVGKSSLINALTGQNALARTSHTPGRTRQLNCFDLGGRLRLVDMPGYGYAKAPKNEVAQWQKLIAAYLRGRPELRRACVLIDSRHGLKDIDRAVLDDLNAAAVVFMIVLTKRDEIKPSALEQLIAATHDEIDRMPAAFPQIIATSARTGAGIPDLRACLAELAAAPAQAVP